MAAYPPPTGAPFGPPYGMDPRQASRLARQQLKAQARAQKAAFQAQRYAYRQQVRSLRRTSILGPITLIIVGIVALLLRSGRLPYARFASWFTQWWPLILVAAGLILAAEWAFDQRPHPDGSPTIRRSFAGGAFFLFFVLALTGGGIEAVNHGRPFFEGLSINPDNVGEIFGEKHESTQPIDQAFPINTSLVIDNPHGDVTISGKSGDNQIHIIVTKQVYSSSDSDADSKAQQLNPHLFLSGSVLNVNVPSVNGGTADLAITLPAYADTTVNANHGDVDVSDLHAPVIVTANHGDIQFNNIAGPVTVHVNRNDASVSAHNITGAVTVRGHAEDLNITDVSGETTLEGEFFGDTHLERLAAPIAFRTSRTQFTLARLDGEIDISPNSELTGNQIVGPTLLRTSSRNISLERLAGPVNITNSKGSVDLSSSAPLGNIMVQNRDGSVSLTIPDHAGLTVDAETRGGEIENDLGLSTTDQNGRTTLHGTVGNGAANVILRTDHLDIDIHKGDIQPPTPPAPPAVPPTPKPHPTAPKAPTPPTTPI